MSGMMMIVDTNITINWCKDMNEYLEELMLANTDFTSEQIAEMENWEILMYLGWE